MSFMAIAVVSLGALGDPVVGIDETVETVVLSKDGVEITVKNPARVDVARDFWVRVKAVAPAGTTLEIQDLRDRFSGFDFLDDDRDWSDVLRDGSDSNTTYESCWELKLVPKPCEEVYRLAPFVVTILREGTPTESSYTAPLYFEGPETRAPVTGDIKDGDWKKDRTQDGTLGDWCIAALAVVAVVAAVWWMVRKIRQKIKEHRMSPIERAMLELDRLLKKGLPGRGRYKDFYVELTMVVRRYVQRQHDVRAPNLTTEEFFDVTRNAPTFPKSTLDLLIDFLRKADMVKFAGVEATPEIASEAADSARSYVVKDDEIVKKKIGDSKRISKIISSRSKK